MLQDGGAPLGLTAGEVVKLWASFHHDPEPVAGLLERVGLAERARTGVRNLSGGERQRLSLAMALVGRPQVAFLDEPTVGMDAGARRSTWRAIGDLARSGVTVILTTHYLQEAEALAGRVAIVDKGKLLALDTPGRLAALTSMDAVSFATDRAVDVEDLSRRLGCSVLPDDGGYRIEARPTPELIATLTALLAGQGVLVTDLRVGLASLEEAFLQLTGTDVDVPRA
jgi:ABC-2 type transport system ATP-binding protein